MARKNIPLGEFELFYLAELTRRRLKPLSRWEKPLNNSQKKWLQQQDLHVETIPRLTLNKTRIYETVFSSSSRYTDLYLRKFRGSFLDKSAASQRFEGILFGYPPCCVEQFIEKPYTRNRFKKENQEILFHWACPDCRITRELIQYYRPVYKNVMAWYENQFGPSDQFGKKIPQKLAWTAALSLWLSTASLLAHPLPDSTHYIPVANDPDGNGLSYSEDIFLGSHQVLNSTQSRWTIFFKTVIDTLPTDSLTNRPYKKEYLTWGWETCQKCGTTVNMGFVRIINPQRQMHIDLPFIALHFMENGCFSYDGDLHAGRVDVDTLKHILFPFDPSHMLTVSGDSDNDGLTDAEEDSFYFYPNIPDTDNDGVPDGARIAEQIIRLFPRLKEQPDSAHAHVKFLPVGNGFEQCAICGQSIYMGVYEITNPENGRKFTIPLINLHSLAHGSFKHTSTAWGDPRADAVDLYRTMKTHMLHLEHDADNDGLSDNEESSFGYDPNNSDSNGNGICDGKELAHHLVTILHSLPISPRPDSPYVIHHTMDGVWNCLICGEPVNMGYMELWNPQVSSDPLIISYYADHFLTTGGFSHEGRIIEGEWLEGRIDPVQLASYLDFPVRLNPSDQVAVKFVLKQNYPNPFNASTKIEFRIPKSGYVTLKIYNIAGQEIVTPLSAPLLSGTYSVTIDASGLASGIYLYRLEAKDFVETKKMILVR